MPSSDCTACKLLAAVERFQTELVEMGHEATEVRIVGIGGSYVASRDVPVGPGRIFVSMPVRHWEEHHHE